MELTQEQALQKGIEAHRAGQVAEADQYYTAILKANPKHPDANHNMGVLAVSVGKADKALPFFKKALEANQSIAQYWLSYINALIKLDRVVDAKVVLDQAKKKGAKGNSFDKLEKQLNPKSFKDDKLTDLPRERLQGLVNLYMQGNYQQALDNASHLLKKFPNSINLFNIIGSANQSLGKLDEAIEAYNQALYIKPDYAEAYNNKGNALKDQGKLEDAIEAYSKALAIKPDFAEAYNNKGNTLKAQGKLKEAIEAINRALSTKPDFAEAYNSKGNALKDQGKLDDAIEAYTKALTIKPDFAEAYCNIGNTLKVRGELDAAIKSYTKALTIKTDFAEAHYNIGNVLRDQGKLEEAIEAYNKTICIKPHFAEAYRATADILKVYSPRKVLSHPLFITDKEIKKLSVKLTNARSSNEIIKNLSDGLSLIDDMNYEFRTPLSQIYRRNEINLNCDRHMKVFTSKQIIPEFCFGCFKVQVEVATLIDLVKLTSLFYTIDFKENLTRKTMIEMRPNIPGFYKGFIYCKGLNQANSVKSLLDSTLSEILPDKASSKIKRGCSEFSMEFPEYGKIVSNPERMMQFPKVWEKAEEQFVKDNPPQTECIQNASLLGYCLSDFYIIQKWIDYARGLGDDTISNFVDRPIIFNEVFEIAKRRTIANNEARDARSR